MSNNTISEPIVQPFASGYEFIWPHGEEQVVTVYINRLLQDRRYNVTAEIKVDLLELGTILEGRRLDIMSERSRIPIIQRLSVINNIIPWAEVIEVVCSETLRLFREGEPVQELWTSEDISPPEYLIDPLLMKGVPTILFGEKATAKSTMALVLYTCLILPWYDNPLGLGVPTESTKVIILDWEAERDIVQWNAKKLQEGMGLPPFPLYWRRCDASLAYDLEQIQAYKEEVGADVLIIDSLAAAAGGEVKDTSTALTFFGALRRLKVTSLIIAQTSKDTLSKKKSTLGSTIFDYYARSVYEMRKSQSAGEDEINTALFHQYCNVGKLQAPMGLRISFENNSTAIERQDARGVGEFLERMGTQTRIVEELKLGALLTKDLVERLGITRAVADTNLKRLKDKGKVVKRPDGKWGLAWREDYGGEES